MEFGPDGSLLVKKPVKREHITVFSLISELDFPVGKKLLITLLLGEQSSQVIKLRLDKQVHYGSLGGYSREELDQFIEYLLLEGFLAREQRNRFTVIVLSDKGLQEMEERNLSLSPDMVPSREEQPEPVVPQLTPSPITSEDEEVFLQLDFFLKNFTREQKKAIIDKGEKQLCIAGAGSGKTRVLTHKIEFLVKYAGVKPKDILAITFTRKARQEMMHRLEQLGISVRVETFNSFAEKELIRHGDTLYGQEKRMASNQEFVTLVIQTLLEIGFEIETFLEHYFTSRERAGKEQRQLLFSFLYDFRAILDAYILSGKDDLYFVSRIQSAKLSEKITAQNIAKLAKLVHERLEEKGLRTYGDQLLDVNKLYENRSDLITSFGWVLVDEYQDVNEAQTKLLSFICEKHLFVVGDPRQSIYAWRGANPDTIFEFVDEKTVILELTINFRSSQQVVDYANKLMKGYIPLSSNSKESGCVEVKQYATEDEEVQSTLAMIKALEVPRSEVFILSRTNKGLEKFVEACNAQHIPYLLRTDERKETGHAPDEDQITLSTVHAIKGLEAQVVFVVGSTSSMYPCRTKDHRFVDLLGSKQDYNQYEEERRIFYVACTRAKQALFISYCGAPSPFLGIKGDPGIKSDAQRKALKRWRFLESKERDIPAYRIFTDKVLEQLLELQPNTTDELYSIS
ncbi:MAG: exodeoxyribonuclease V subunit gamma, partial [Nanoarchaeota archaeon]|nr:exodeoxyribonuclease V subunit gamma [Nanoarchaeota archaeon]